MKIIFGLYSMLFGHILSRKCKIKIIQHSTAASLGLSSAGGALAADDILALLLYFLKFIKISREGPLVQYKKNFVHSVL